MGILHLFDALVAGVADRKGQHAGEDHEGGRKTHTEPDELGGAPVLVTADLNERQQDEPTERQRDQQLPAEVHELVVAEAGQGGSHPDEQEQEAHQLHEEPEDTDPPAGSVIGKSLENKTSEEAGVIEVVIGRL